jgi:four helix bundle protein
MSNFENLKVWHRAIDLAVSIYKLTDDNRFLQKDFGLKDQLRRASVSISSNISEGDELGSDKQAIRQFYIAKGSAAELYTQIIIAYKIRYIQEAEKEYLINECKGISGMLTNLIKSRYSD